MNLPEGHSLQNAKYHLTKVIGQGGFGITYLGVWNMEAKGNLGTVKTEVPICIKEYFFKDYCYRDKDTFHVKVHSETGRLLFDKFKGKLIKEAKILSDVHHPYIVNVLEVFEENDTAYIIMEHIAGCSLKYMLDVEGVLPEQKVLRYISQIAQALEFVHQKNVLHLDIKPSNILIDKKNNARLIDFGVSKRYDIEQQETSTTMLTLSKGFAPIEQYDNEGTQSFSPCPDIYSLGATMYNLLTGEIPTESILRATKPLIKPSEINKDITAKTEAVILTAMQVNPIHRYQSVKAMMNELDIPSYFEDATNSLIEETVNPLHQSNEEGTELLTDSKPSQPVDEEETQVRLPEVKQETKPKKKSKRRVLILSFIIVFAVLAGGIAYFFDSGDSRGTNRIADLWASIAGTSKVIVEDEPIVPADSIPNIENSGEITANTPQVESTRPVTTDTPPQTTVTNSPQVNQDPLPEDNANTISPEQIEAEVNELIESGKAKMREKKWEDATADFEKAREIRKAAGLDLSEISKLIADTDEQAIEERLAKYDISIVPIGDYKVATLRTNGKCGAVDSAGKEIIPCKYRGTGLNDDGTRNFYLDDNQTDIYDRKGDFVKSINPSLK